MTLSIFEYGACNDYSGEPLIDTLVRRRTALAIANTYHQLGETSPIACFIISNDDGTTGVRVRFHTASSGADADQGDIYIGANSTRTFWITRKRRDATYGPTDDFYVNGVADA